jgi:ABC-type dipeptide/oligopeptide/nickel transport system ATPase subunit
VQAVRLPAGRWGDRAAAAGPWAGRRFDLGGREIRTISSVRAVDGVSFDLNAGETLALVGGLVRKSTTGRMLLRLTRRHQRDFAGTDLLGLGHPRSFERREMQIVFQDPYSSLSPRQVVEDIVAEPLDVYRLSVSRAARRERVIELLRLVGLDAVHLRRHPFEFSGGQRQRIAIARAIAPEPRMIVADEPVSALDVSIRSQVVNLLQDLQERFGIAYLFISHDLAVVRHIAHRIGDVPGPAGGAGRARRAVRRSAPSLHAGAPVGGARTGSGAQARSHHPEGRCAQSRARAGGMPLPSALSHRAGDMSREHSAIAEDGGRAACRLSLRDAVPALG